MDWELRAKELAWHLGRAANVFGEIHGDLFAAVFDDEADVQDDDPRNVALRRALLAQMETIDAVSGRCCEDAAPDVFDCDHEWDEDVLVPTRSCRLCALSAPSMIDPDSPEGVKLHRLSDKQITHAEETEAERRALADATG